MRIEHVSAIMGHSNIKETQRYAKVINKDIDDYWGQMGSLVDIQIEQNLGAKKWLGDLYNKGVSK